MNILLFVKKVIYLLKIKDNYESIQNGHTSTHLFNLKGKIKIVTGAKEHMN